jgi:DNA-binding LytR/AlgR family response regulator
MKIRTIAVDDEPLALQLLTGYIRKTPFLELTGAFDNPLDALELIRESEPDLLFLDIQMPDLTGTEFARTLENGPRIIFITAFDQYALEGFRLDAVDYILKPYSYQEFLIAANKALKIISLEQKPEATIETSADYLFVKSEYKIRRIRYDLILYIEGLRDYIKIYVKGEPRAILSLNTLRALESKLPSDRFMRVHRSFIVNLDQIETIDRSRIVFGDTYVPISDQYREKFQEFLDKNFL